MKANELRIGNLIKRIHSNSFDKVNGYDLLHSEKLNDVNHLVEWNDLEPILLSAEWLIKAGFKRTENISPGRAPVKWEKYFTHEELWDLVFLLDENNFRIDWTSSISYGQCKYVHQLQNLYYSLTGEELTVCCKICFGDTPLTKDGACDNCRKIANEILK